MTAFPRLIAKFDIKDGRVKKTRRLEGLRDIGDAPEVISASTQGREVEVLLNFFTASLYAKELELETLQRVRQEMRLPITYSGGIRNLRDAESVISTGADRIAVNTHLLTSKDLLGEFCKAFGEQSVVVQVEVGLVSGEYRLLTKAGREISHVEIADWLAFVGEHKGVELMITSVDTEGASRGFPLDLAKHVTNLLGHDRIIFCGGFASDEHIREIQCLYPESAFCSASLFLS